MTTADKLNQHFFKGFATVSALSIWASIGLGQIWWLVFPFVLLIVFQTIIDYKLLYWALWAAVPISTEIFLPNGLSTDLPTEPLIVGLMLVFGIKLLAYPEQIGSAFFKHPVTLWLLFHLFWIGFTTLFSDNFTISFKFFLSKIWYVATFYFLSGLILNDLKSAQKLFWCFFIPLALATAKVFMHHATLNFGFKEINEATFPFFRNHVNYAAILALSIPLAWFVWGWYSRWTFRWWLMFGILGMLFLGLLFAYTRAAYLALVMAMGAYWVIRWRLVTWVLAAGTVLASVVFVILVQENKFMDLAPSERTIAHTDFKDIVSATYKLEDVSTMERYYRWIAGVRMADENIWVGFGPGNFYTFYKEYTLNRFITYVSRNPEQSGIHNYFLMTLAEQGIFGLVIFLGLIFSVLIYGQSIYHQLQNPHHKDLAMGLMLSQIVIYAFLLMNDMVETDKVGSFFFLNMALLVALRGWESPTPPKSADKI